VNTLSIAKRGLGVLSIGIGLMALTAPRRLSGWLGMKADPAMMSAFGAREVAAGSGLLSPVEPGPWLWMRVGGDVMDLAALGGAMSPRNPKRKLVAAVAAVVGVITIIDLAMAARSVLEDEENEAAAKT